MTEKTLETLQAEAEAAKNKLAEIEKETYELQQAARRAKEAAEREERNKREELKRVQNRKAFMIHANAVAKELEKLGHDVEITNKEGSAYPSIVVPGTISIHFENRSSSWSPEPSSTVIKVGRYSDGVRYPIKKDGTFNYAKIAAKFDEKFKTEKAASLRYQAKQQANKESEAIASRLRKQYGSLPYEGASYYNLDGINVHGNDYDADKVLVKVSMSLTEEQAAKFIELVQSFKEN